MNIKGLGQVFTPEYIVNFILDECGYDGDIILNSKILEPSAGNGNFIIRIIDRIFSVARKNNKNDRFILKTIKENVFGVEIDSHKYDELLRNIVSHINSKLSSDKITGIFFENNFFNEDSLFKKYNFKFDFIVGNPPYIRLHNLEKNFLNKLRSNFISMEKGSVDLYYAFFEYSFNLLNESGKLCFITPNNFLINNSAKNLRNLLIENISSIHDFQSEKIFANASTYNSITLITRKKSKLIKAFLPKIIDQTIYKGESTKIIKMNNKIIIPKGKNILKIHLKAKPDLKFKNGLATLADNIFISDNVDFSNGDPIFNGFEIEKEILIPTFKASLDMGKNTNRFSIFPYKINYETCTVTPMTEDELKKFPKTYKYLISHKKRLIERSLDTNAEWFHFGRSQAINSILFDKVVVKTLIKDSLKFDYVKKGTLVYSGLFSEYTNSKKDITSFLNSNDLYEFLISLGSDKSGGYKQISSSLFEEVFNEKK